jgi:putative transposase
MENLKFSQGQVTHILREIAQGEDGYHQVLKLSLEALMQAERKEYNCKTEDKSNGFRTRKTFGRGKILELQVPRTRNGQFYPLLLTLLKDQEKESRQIAFSLYGAGLTTSQVGDVFQEIYGKHYSKSSVSNMFEYARQEVKQYLARPLESYYPIVYIDATFIPVRREDSVSKEAFYTVLGVKTDQTREVLSIVNFPQENVIGWKEVLLGLQARGVKEISLVVSDGLKGLEEAVVSLYASAEHQLCVLHLKRNVLGQVKSKDKPTIAQELKEIFKTGDSSYKPAAAWQNWQEFTRKWGKIYPSIQRMGEDERYHLYMSYLNYHPSIQSMLYTTNWIERLNKDYKRVTKMRGSLPSSEATLLLLGGVAINKSTYGKKVPFLSNEQVKFRWDVS